MHRWGKLVVVVVATASLLVPAASPASATAGGSGEFTGSGAVLPSLTATGPTTQSWTWTGTLAGTFTAGTATASGLLSCVFTGQGLPETLVAGSGTAHESCEGGNVGSVAKWCDLFYDRVGTVIQLSGLCTLRVGTQYARVRQTAVLTMSYYQATAPYSSYQLTGQEVVALAV